MIKLRLSQISFVVFILAIAGVGTIAILNIFDDTTKEVPCYDGEHNEIKGMTCIREADSKITLIVGLIMLWAVAIGTSRLLLRRYL